MHSQYQGIGGRRNKPMHLHRNTPSGSVIPHAPIGRTASMAADKDLRRWRKLLNQEYPLMDPEDIIRQQQPYYAQLLNEMMIRGESVVAHEINSIFRKEEKERLNAMVSTKRAMPKSLKDSREKLDNIVGTLRLCHKYNKQGLYEAAVNLRKTLAENLMHNGDYWISKHFYLSCLSATKRMAAESSGIAQRIQAEVHCLLAFLARENNETLDSALAIAVDHLAIARSLSHDRMWQFKPKVLTIKLKKPIAIHGHGVKAVETDEMYETVDGCSMTIYMIATLLEHEMLISLANQIMHAHKVPTDEDVKIAHEFADTALKLALEVRQPTALSSALLRFGLVLRHIGAYEDALTYFEQLQQHSIVTADHQTEAIAFHNLGLCLVGCHESSKALQSFAKQMDIATDFNLYDLEADSTYEIGHLLLQEGHLWEAEECYAIAYENFEALNHPGNTSAWAMLGLSAGQKIWSRYAYICRHNKFIDTYNLLDWKCSRRTLNPAHRPNYKPQVINKLYPEYVTRMQPVPLDEEGGDVDYEAMADQLELSLETTQEGDVGYEATADELELSLETTQEEKKRTIKVSLENGDEDEYEDGEDEEEDWEDGLPGRSEGFALALQKEVDLGNSEMDTTSATKLPKAQPFDVLYNIPADRPETKHSSFPTN